MLDVGAKRDRTARNRTSAILGYKETDEDSLRRRQCHRVALSFRQCSFLATYLARSIYVGRLCEGKPSARNRASAPLGYKETEEDSLPKRQCHPLSFRQCCVLRRTLLVRFTQNHSTKTALQSSWPFPVARNSPGNAWVNPAWGDEQQRDLLTSWLGDKPMERASHAGNSSHYNRSVPHSAVHDADRLLRNEPGIHQVGVVGGDAVAGVGDDQA